MRRIDGRVRKLEDRLGITPAPGFRILLTDRDFEPGEEAAFLRVLEEAGLLNPNGFAVVNLTHVPRGLSVEEMQRFVEEKHRVPAPKASPAFEVCNGTLDLPTSGIRVVNLMDFAPGLNAAETETHVPTIRRG